VTTEIPRKQQIEDAASTLFRERGYAATSVRDIAQVLNLQGGSLYAHVASKEDMLWAIVLRAADRFNLEVGPIASSQEPAGVKLKDMIRAHVGVVTTIQKDAAVFLHEWRFLSDERRLKIAARRDDYERLFRRVIADGVANGDFINVEPRLTATAILSALNGIATWYRPDGELSATDIADQHASLFLDGLANPDPNFMMRTFS
jgi:TetR/AcrR family transcriptional regulator, cholesterol catabolism regulator